jgi:hypothetical protein
MKIRRIVIYVLLTIILTACAPAFDAGPLESRISTLEARPEPTPQPQAGYSRPIEDTEPRLYLGDEDVTGLIDVLWIALTDGGVDFGWDASTDALSNDHAGVFYIIPGDDIQTRVNWTGYDKFAVGSAIVYSGDKSPRQRTAAASVRWVQLPEDHPRAGRYALTFWTHAWEYYALEPGGVPSLMLMQATTSRMDVPWHYHYGTVGSGHMPVCWLRSMP